MQDKLGDWALNLLLATLCLSPLKLKHYRRAVGLWCYFYACLHFVSWLWLDKEFELAEMAADIVKRRWILVGFSSLVLMTPLALTSTDWAIRKLRKNWGRLHRLIYPAAILACVHYLWQVKLDRRWPYAYLCVLFLLLGWRVTKRLQDRSGGVMRKA